MSCSFISLPRELRQRILLLALPQVIQPAVIPYFSVPAQNLLHISRTVRQEMYWVMNNYSPRFYFHSPSHLVGFLSSLSKDRGILPFEYNPKFEHVSFDIFYDADVDTMQSTCVCRMHNHNELFNAWAAAVLALPDQVKTMLLDITPAPGWMRENRPEWVQGFTQDSRISKKFISRHEAVTLRLIQCTHEHFGDDFTMQLSGQLSEKSRSRLDAIVARSVTAGIDISFVGDLLAVQPRRKKPRPQIWKAVYKLSPLRPGWIEEENSWGYLPGKNEQEQRLAKLRHISWSVDTQKLWSRIGYQDEAWAIRLLVDFGYFVADDNLKQMNCSPMDNIQRALVHNMAKDLHYTSQAVGEEPERFVRVEKCA